jgi:hypothetical protein
MKSYAGLSCEHSFTCESSIFTVIGLPVYIRPTKGEAHPVLMISS